MFKRLKKKWGIGSNSQFWLIFGIFAISGSSTLFVKIPVYALFDITHQTDTWIKVLVYILAITPAYFMLLLLYGTIFGQFRFFWNFTRNFFIKMFFWKKIQVPRDLD